jgi:hypothetical protein
MSEIMSVGGRETDSVRENKKISRCSDLMLLDACTLIRWFGRSKEHLFFYNFH